MPTATPQRVYDLLHQMPTQGLSALKRLVWTELNYARVAAPLSTRAWPAAAQNALADEPTLLASAATAAGSFDVIYVRLAAEQVGRGAALSLTAERAVIEQLLLNHPYALFVFSDAAETHWHLVNVKYRREQPGAAALPVFRRITVGPRERLRTAAERVALLDLAALAVPLSPLAIQQRHDDAFDVEAVTRAFFSAYDAHFKAAEGLLTGLPETTERRLFTQQLFNRVLFIAFLERKGWLTFQGRQDYLAALWEAHQATRAADPQANFYADRLRLLFFAGLNNPDSVNITGITRDGPLTALIGDVPYLNGGLFEQTPLDRRADVTVPDAVFAPLFADLLYHYNFTVTESTPLDVEVAVDPEMLGKIFEELVTGRHESGSYYTPKPIVAFMCREALKGHLRDRCPRESAGAIAAFVDARDARDLRAPEAVLSALREARACDPACGSGAYLLGLLHELVELRQALFVSQRLDARSAYERKLEIIQRNLYGVDKDEFAVNIARLRLWLSLIVDFDGDTPPPLPNLDFKIEVGDSLTAPAPAQLQPDLFHHQLVQDYFRLKGQFMTAHGPEKGALREKIAAVQREIAEWAGTSGDPGAFDWTVEFAEVFTGPGEGAATAAGQMTGVVNATVGQMQLAAREGPAPGFDIIVANPPYVRQELIKELKPLLKQRYPEVYTGVADLYVYFYARALQLLREGGMMAFISSNKWLRAGYGQPLRQHLQAQATVETLVDFGDLPVFGAIAYPQIIVFRKRTPPEGHAVRALEVDDLAVIERLADVVPEQAWAQPQASLRAEGWSLVKPDVRKLLKKLREAGTPLGEYVGGKFYRGVTTGLNKAFVIDENTCEQLIAADDQSVEIIKPWIRGQDIDRWRIDSDELYLLWTYTGIEMQKYPAVLRYLEGFREQLANRWEPSRGQCEWYELRPCAYYSEFEKPKIVYPDIAKSPEFTYDTAGIYGGNTMYIIPTDDLFLLGLLNSSVVEFFYTQTSATIRGDYLRFIATYMKRIPIPEPTADQRADIEALVGRLLEARGQGPRVAAWEGELNALVYQVYGLTGAEIELVEG